MNLLESVISDTKTAQAQQAKKSAEKAITNTVARIRRVAKAGKNSYYLSSTYYGRQDPHAEAKRQYLENQGFAVTSGKKGFHISW